MSASDPIERAVRLAIQQTGATVAARDLRTLVALVRNLSTSHRGLVRDQAALNRIVADFARTSNRAYGAANRGARQHRRAVNQLQSGYAKLTKTVLAFAIPVGFRQALKTLEEYNKILLKTSASAARFGISMSRLDGTIASLSSKTGLLRSESLRLFEVYQKGVPLANLKGFEQVITRITKVVGPNAQAAGEFLGSLTAIINKFPDLQQKIEAADSGNKGQLQNLTRRLFLTGQIGRAEFENVQTFLRGSTRSTREDEKRTEALLKQQKLFQEMRRYVERFAMAMARSVLPILETLRGWFTSIADKVDTFFRKATAGSQGFAKGLERILNSVGLLAAALGGLAAIRFGPGLLGLAGAGGAAAGLGGAAGVGAGVGMAGSLGMGAVALGSLLPGRRGRRNRWRTNVAVARARRATPWTSRVGGGLARGARGGLLAMGGVGLGYAADDIGRETKTGAGVGLAGSAAVVGGGAMMGAGVGSMLLPGPGTAIGAGVGALIGAFAELGNIVGSVTTLFSSNAEAIRAEAEARVAYEKAMEDFRMSLKADTDKDVRDRLNHKQLLERAQKDARESFGESGFAGMGDLMDRQAVARATVQAEKNKIAAQYGGGRESLGLQIKILENRKADLDARADLLAAGPRDEASRAKEQVVGESLKLVNAEIMAREDELGKINATVREQEELNGKLREAENVVSQTTAKLEVYRIETEKIKAQMEVSTKLLGAQSQMYDATIKHMQDAGVNQGNLTSQLDTTIDQLRRTNVLRSQYLTSLKEEGNPQARAAAMREAGHDALAQELEDLIEKNKHLSAEEATLAIITEIDAKRATQQRDINDLIAKGTDAWSGQIGVASEITSLMQNAVSLMDNFAVGVGASAEARLQAVAALQREIGLIGQQINWLKGQQAAGKDSLVIQQQILKLQNQQFSKMQQQASLTRQLKDGWISAIGAMNTGAGTFSKIIIGQEGNTAQLLSTVGALTSAVTGSYGGGYDGSARYSAYNDGGPGKMQPHFAYKTWYDKQFGRPMGGGAVDSFMRGNVAGGMKSFHEGFQPLVRGANMGGLALLDPANRERFMPAFRDAGKQPPGMFLGAAAKAKIGFGGAMAARGGAGGGTTVFDPAVAAGQDEQTTLLRSIDGHLRVVAGKYATTPSKKAGGGFVPGSGSGDTVPAMLSPGEMVLNQRQQAGMFGSVSNARSAFAGARRYHAGGIVGDPLEREFIKLEKYSTPTEEARLERYATALSMNLYGGSKQYDTSHKYGMWVKARHNPQYRKMFNSIMGTKYAGADIAGKISSGQYAPLADEISNEVAAMLDVLATLGVPSSTTMLYMRGLAFDSAAPSDPGKRLDFFARRRDLMGDVARHARVKGTRSLIGKGAGIASNIAAGAKAWFDAKKDSAVSLGQQVVNLRDEAMMAKQKEYVKLERDIATYKQWSNGTSSLKSRAVFSHKVVALREKQLGVSDQIKSLAPPGKGALILHGLDYGDEGKAVAAKMDAEAKERWENRHELARQRREEWRRAALARMSPERRAQFEQKEKDRLRADEERKAFRDQIGQTREDIRLANRERYEQRRAQRRQSFLARNNPAGRRQAYLARMRSRKMATGGIVPGNADAGDVVSAFLSPGEIVLNENQQTGIFGSPSKARMVFSQASGSNFASGGVVGAPSSGTMVNIGGINLNTGELNTLGIRLQQKIQKQIQDMESKAANIGAFGSGSGAIASNRVGF